MTLDALSAHTGERELGDAILGCLREGARRGPHGCPEDRFRGRGLWWSPIVYSRSFLASRWLIDDVQRFFPCRVALAHVEELTDDGSIEAAERAVSLLQAGDGRGANWRALFSPTGEVGRPLSATLAEFGEHASAYALWGLRCVPLHRRAQSLTHVEVLGALGRHPDVHRLTPHMQLIEDASVDELTEQLQRVPRGCWGCPTTSTAATPSPRSSPG